MKHYHFLKDTLSLFVVYFLTVIVFTDYIKSMLDAFIAFLAFALITIPLTFPVFVLHMQYYLNDKQHAIFINSGNVFFKHGGEVKKIEVKKITRFKRFKKGELYFQYLPWADYYYLEIESIEHSIFHLSCLSAEGKITELNNIIEEKKSFPAIKPHWLERIIL